MVTPIKRNTPQTRRTRKPAIKRAIRKPRNTTLLNNVRTVESITRALGKMPKPMANMGGAYLHCRMDPFSSDGKGSIPDGGNTGFFTVDNRTVDNIVIGDSGNYIIQTLPTLPCSAVMLGTGGATGTKINGANIVWGTGPPVLVPNLSVTAPLSVLPQWLSAVGTLYPGQSFNDVYNASNARLVSVGYKLTYTGQILSCAGSITVTPNDVAISPFSQVTNASPFAVANTLAVTLDTSDLSGSYYTKTGTNVLQLDGSTNPNALTRDSVVFRPEEGVYIIPKHKTNVFKNIPITDTVSALVSNPTSDQTTGALTFNMINATNSAFPNSVYQGGVIWYDNDWSGVQVTIAGMTPGSTFRWDTIWCMEINPAVSSPFASLTVKASPNNPSAITTAQAASNAKPVAAPGRPVNPVIVSPSSMESSPPPREPSSFKFHNDYYVGDFNPLTDWNSSMTFKKEDGYLTLYNGKGGSSSYERRRP